MDQSGQDDIATRQLLGTESIRRFVVVAEELHFGRAAARLFVTQSTLSVQIQQLEAEVGGPLFVRTSRQVELTESGRLLRVEARRALDQADRALRVVQQSILGEAGSIRIGFVGVAAYGGTLPADLGRFHDAHPGVEIEVRELAPATILDALRSGAIDLGYTLDLQAAPIGDLSRLARKHIELTAALRADHRLAGRPALSRADLHSETLILPSTHPGSETIADRIRQSVPGQSAPVRLVPSTLGVLTLAAAGLGVAIVPADAALLAIGGLVFRPIADVTGLGLIIVSRRDETLGPVLAYLRSFASGD